jgi:endonuclease/exonuclease/phosphatase family metal-dependent hydrolase
MIEFITWNVQSARTAAGTADWQQAAAALGRFPDAAILCLQEVASGFPAGRAATAIALDVASPDGGRRRLGCMTFSRYPVL